MLILFFTASWNSTAEGQDLQRRHFLWERKRYIGSNQVNFKFNLKRKFLMNLYLINGTIFLLQ